MKSESNKAGSAKGRRTIIVASVAAIIVVGLIVGIAIYRDRVAPFRTPIVVVDNTSVPMRYFLKRIVMTGSQPMAVLETLIQEQIIKQVAPKPPYNIQIDDEEVDQFLREIVEGQNDAITDGEYEEWYRQQVNESRLSDAEFRDLVRTTLLSMRLTEYLVLRTPTVSEQVYLHVISVADFDSAQIVRQRLDAGEDFAVVAQELSMDEELRQSGGDLGWFPRGALPPNISEAAFDELEIGEVSEPLYLTVEEFAVIVVSDRSAAREIDEVARQGIRNRVLDEWLRQELPRHTVEFQGLNNGGYDSETDAWVYWQVEAMKRQ